MPGSKAVGQGLRDGTVGGVTAVVTAAGSVSAVDDIVCTAKELTATRVSDPDLSSGSGSVSTLTSTASTLLSGADVLVDSAVTSAALPESGFFVGSVVSSSSLDFEPLCAPPVLTTTPGGAWVVVDPVDVDDVGSVDDGCVGSVAVGFSAGSAEADVSVDVDVSVDDDSVDDGSEDGVSAHATGNPYPVTTATPTPRATANPPTRPT